MNTTMHYTYCDGSNYKVLNTVILSGHITEEQKNQIQDCLDDGENFVPRQVGLPEKRFEIINEDDGPYFELDVYCAFEDTEEKPTVDISVDELVNAFRRNKGCWDVTWPFNEYGCANLSTSFTAEERQQIFEEVLFEKKTALIQEILSRWYFTVELNPRTVKYLRKYHQQLKIDHALYPDEFFKLAVGFSINELSQAFARLKQENELYIPEERIEWLLTKILFGEPVENGCVMSYTRKEFAERANALMGQDFLLD